MKTPPAEPKAILLRKTHVWREAANTIVLAGDFGVINVRRRTSPTTWATLDRYLRAHGK